MCATAIAGDFEGDAGFDESTADGLAGFYEHRWAITQVARIGSKLVTLDPSQLDPSLGMLVLEHVEDLAFRYPTTIPLASPGEIVRFEQGDPPTMQGPSTLAVPRSDTLVPLR